LFAAAGFCLCACATPEPGQPTGKLSDVFATPEWAKFSGAKPSALRAVTQDDLVTSDGRCAAIEPAVAQTTDGSAPNFPEASSDALAGQGPLPNVQSGVALSMTECQVVQRTGAPERIDISAEGQERIATMTVTRGSSPGLYRFRGGRLVSIERIDVPAPPKTAKAKKSVPKSQPGLRGAQQ
jgi:hypothetical protein